MKSKQLIQQLRKLISQCTDDEKTIYVALLEEADSWEMRLAELENEEDEEE